ncbi:coiled-coil domain-containing protein 160 homolog [Anneissia japonica]|uniref:coiled-coil domain-containing protein 160 homolog n=1 Tax=Anneissia japonica TaxID=1529436 RepID=UPI001425B3D1|nr:coiled-coil domain-containing protein 160 homolog [Anneissia japonica]XP_033109907.1 coiled-coil domain-containing protein 160 homolog [Anneissia japonica]XP_033109908.1 coiled-coil domain-containing protein 160 homolog [Anneissia japonica]
MTLHWVETLFPPTFKYNDLGELLTNDKQLQEIKTHYEPSKISRTTEPIENIYERVRTSYNIELESRRQKCIQVGDPLRKFAKQKTVASESLTITEPSKEDPCLWTNHEMNILREAYQVLKQEKMKTEEELKVIKKAFKRKQEKAKQYRKELEEQREIVKGLRDENTHIEIVCKHVSKDLKAAQSVEVFLREDIEDLKNQKHAQQKIIEGLRKDLAEERRKRKQISIDLEEVRHKCQQESELKEESLRLDCDIHVKRLYKVIIELELALEKEKNEHVISKKGLDHLRSHFAGLVDHKSEANIDELKNFSPY